MGLQCRKVVFHRRCERARVGAPPILCSVSDCAARPNIFGAAGQKKNAPERPGRIPRAPAPAVKATPCDPFPNLFFPKMLPNTNIVPSSKNIDSETLYTPPPPPASRTFCIKKRGLTLLLYLYRKSPWSHLFKTTFSFSNTKFAVIRKQPMPP